MLRRPSCAHQPEQFTGGQQRSGPVGIMIMFLSALKPFLGCVIYLVDSTLHMISLVGFYHGF